MVVLFVCNFMEHSLFCYCQPFIFLLISRYPKMIEKDFAEACPVCRDNCNCKSCLRLDVLLNVGWFGSLIFIIGWCIYEMSCVQYYCYLHVWMFVVGHKEVWIGVEWKRKNLSLKISPKKASPFYKTI